jgi:hypothetical protein
MGQQLWPVSFFTQGVQLPSGGNFPVTATDPDAAAYIDLVQQYDNAALESGVQSAIDTFVTSLKSSNLWDDIIHLQLLTGPRTLEGLTVPLKGTGPNLYGFDISDYDRRTGLKGDGISKYVDTNVSMANIFNADGKYFMVRIVRATNLNSAYLGANSMYSTQGSCLFGVGGTSTTSNLRVLVAESITTSNSLIHDQNGVYGISKMPGGLYNLIYPTTTSTTSNTLNTSPLDRNIYVLCTNDSLVPSNHSNGRVGIYILGNYTTSSVTASTTIRTHINTFFTAMSSVTLT